MHCCSVLQRAMWGPLWLQRSRTIDISMSSLKGTDTEPGVLGVLLMLFTPCIDCLTSQGWLAPSCH